MTIDGTGLAIRQKAIGWTAFSPHSHSIIESEPLLTGIATSLHLVHRPCTLPYWIHSIFEHLLCARLCVRCLKTACLLSACLGSSSPAWHWPLPRLWVSRGQNGVLHRAWYTAGPQPIFFIWTHKLKMQLSAAFWLAKRQHAHISNIL